MRGLTPAERRELAGFEGTVAIVAPDESENVLDALVEQGRVKFTATPDHPDYDGRWDITPAGIEALKIDAAVRALGVAV